MALSGLDIYKHLPKTNCRECGFPTCLAFAMTLAKKQTSLDKCPHVSDEAKQRLETAALPPMRLIKIGSQDRTLEVGNETVLFRHEEKFHHPTGIGFLIEDNLSDDKFKEKIEHINNLRFERVGQEIKVDLIAIRQTADVDSFVNKIKLVNELTNLSIVLVSNNSEALKKALEILQNKRPIIYAATRDNVDEFVKLAKEYNCNLVVSSESLDELSDLTSKVNSSGFSDIILDTGIKPLTKKIDELTQLRRLALKKNYRAFGYPNIVMTYENDVFREISIAATLLTKYANIIILKGTDSWQVLSLLTLRQNIYTDPQKPLQVESRVYPVGAVNEKSPLLITTNFSLTYYTVLSEVESSKVPSYILTVDTEGMSVLTAWAAEKFTAESISEALENKKAKLVVNHNQIIIPGYVAAMSGDLQEQSGWEVLVGPREASGITNFLKNIKV
jgi:acetyl-CoA decarbonylase/synthase complex subunit gamma